MKRDISWIKRSVPLTQALLRAQALPLFLLFLAELAVTMGVENSMGSLGPADDSRRWMIQLSAAVFEIAAGILLFLLLSWGIPKIHKFPSPKFLAQPFATPYLSSFFAEYLRMVAQFLMYLLLLVVPGLVRYCQVSFMPFIALFDSSYRAGKEDALRLSERLVRGRLPLIFGLLALIVLISVAFEFLPHLSPALSEPVPRVLIAAVGFLISVWGYSVMFLLFESLRQNLPEEEKK